MTGDMNDGPTIRIKTVSTGELPFCQRCGQRAVMTVDLRPFGGNVDALCRSCDRAYPGRVAWLDLLASGKLKGNLSEAIIE